MCGIAGVLSRRGPAETAAAVHRMMDAIAHRGPDSQGCSIRSAGEWTVGLGHTRLAILDLSEQGAQPMVSARSSYITYNGEVYNFLELRAELEALGHRFHSGTDTEVIQAAFERWGPGSLSRLRGMFAFGLWDECSREMTLVRDTLGIKPLYYHLTPDTLVFASEVRALLASGLTPRRLSKEGLQSYLRYGSIETPHTAIQGIESLRPGEVLTLPVRGRTLVARASRISEPPPPPAVANRDEAVSELRRVLAESVRLHLISDVPVAAFLSGGIDSSAIVGLMSQFMTRRPSTFSVIFEEKEFSEVSSARSVAARFGTEHTELMLGETQLLEMLPDAIGSMDQPTADGVNTFVIARAVRQAGCKVALSGLGGDELFAGYPSFRRALSWRVLSRIPKPVRATVAVAGRAMAGGSVSRGKLWQMLESGGEPHSVYAISRQMFSGSEVDRLLCDRAPFNGLESFAAAEDVINAVSGYEIRGYMANTLLRDTDFMSMAHSLEVRVPFVDTAVIRFVMGLPGSWKMARGQTKPLLVDALRDLLPVETWRRPKMGFTLPFLRWMRSALQPEIEATLNHRQFARLGIESEEVQAIWKRFLAAPARERWSRPWSLYVLAKWCERNGVCL